MDEERLAEELAQEDEEAGRALARVDALTALVTALCRRAADSRRLLEVFPEERRLRTIELERARDELVLARRELEQAEAAAAGTHGKDERARAERAKVHAATTVRVAEAHVERLERRLEELADTAAGARDERERLLVEAQELADELRSAPRCSARDLCPLEQPDHVEAWAAAARAALLVASSGLAAEKDALQRQRAELAALRDS